MIFLERQIAAQAHALTTNLILEVQRSLDFYQTQMGIAAPVQLYLDPFFGKDEAMVNQLSTELTMPVKVLTLSDFFTFGKEFAPSKEAHMISVLGAALQAAPLEGELCQFIDFSQGLPKKQRLYLPVKMMLWLWGVLLAVLIGFSMISAVQNNVLKRQIKKVQVETQNLSDQLLKISRVYADAAKKVSTDKELAQLKSEVNIKTKILDELKKLIAQNKPSFSMDLTYFAQKIVPDVWLTAISLQTQGDVVNLRGSAFDVDSILTFTDRLNQLSLFQDNPLHVVFLERVKTPQIQMNFILSTREAPHA